LPSLNLLLLLFLLPAVAPAQPGQPVVPAKLQGAQAKQYVFTHFNSSNGLSTNIVQNVVQDKNGYIWLATIDGLQRYEGNSFITFYNKPGDRHSIPSDLLTRVLKDGHENIWLWGGNKTGIWDTRNNSFHEVPIEGDNPKQPLIIVSIQPDTRGNMCMLVYEKGLYTFDSARHLFRLTKLLPLWAKWAVVHFIPAPDGSFLFSTHHSGFVVYNPHTGNLNYAGHNPDNYRIVRDLGNQKMLREIHGIYNDTLWYSSWRTEESGAPFIHYYDLSTGRSGKYSIGNIFGLGYFEITGMLRQQNGRLWFYGRTFLVEYTGDAKQAFRLVRNEYKNEQSIKFDMVVTMYEDRQRNVWIATDNGVFLFNPDAQTFTSYSLLRPDGTGVVDGPSQTVFEMDDGRILVGAWGTGLYCYDAAFNPVPLPKSLTIFGPAYSIWSFCRHSATGRVWIGLQEGGLGIFDPATGKTTLMYPDILKRSTVRQIVEDRFGNLWFGMQGGHIVKWNAKEAGNDVNKGYTVVRERDGARIFKMCVDQQGYIWAGTMLTGLLKYDPVTNRETEHYTLSAPAGSTLMGNVVSDLLPYGDSLLLVANNGITVLNIYTRKMRYITKADGLPSNNIACLNQDSRGIIWLGMSHGLCRMNLQKMIFSRFDRRDGLNYDNFNQAGAFRLKDGRLFFPTDHNFTVFDPLRITAAPGPPNAVITGLQTGSRELPVDSVIALKRLTLQHNTSLFLEFSALNYIKQNKIHYYYMLQPLEKEWREAGEEGHAAYNYLPAGNYTFMVKAENSDGVTGNRTTTLAIRVAPPFYNTWWFYCMLILLGAAALYWVDRQRVSRIWALQEVRTQIATNLHSEINTTLNNINLLSEMAKIKADKDITRSKEYIDQISDKSHNMIIAMDDMLWSIDPVNDSMEKTLLRMQEFVEALVNRHGADIDMTMDSQVKTLRLAMKSRHEFFLIFKETLRCMVQHAAGSQILIHIDLVKSKLSLTIQDTGAYAHAFMSNKGSIQEMQKRARSVDAELDIDTDSKGVSVILLMPV
jgi:signal transduction histidine kinase